MEYQELPADILDHQQVMAPTVVHNAKIVRPFEMLSKVKQSDKIDTNNRYCSTLLCSLYYLFGGLRSWSYTCVAWTSYEKEKNGEIYFFHLV